MTFFHEIWCKNTNNGIQKAKFQEKKDPFAPLIMKYSPRKSVDKAKSPIFAQNYHYGKQQQSEENGRKH